MVNYTRYFAAMIILLSIILFITIVNSFKILSPTFPELSDALEKHQGLISLAGLIIVIILFQVGQRIENNNKKAEIRSRLLHACNILSLELTQYRDAFSNNAIMVNDGTNIPYMNGILNLDGYESILSSGLLSYLGQNTQDLIKRLYQRIRLHNDILSYSNNKTKVGIDQESLIQDGILPLVSYYLKSFSCRQDLTFFHDGSHSHSRTTTNTSSRSCT